MSTSTVDTMERGRLDEQFTAAGHKTGHGTAWLWAPPFAMPPLPDWRQVQDPPVVALLDTEIQPHSWLDGESDPGTRAQPGIDLKAPPVPAGDRLGKYYGHGTFIAGLVRRRASGAQLLPLPVMDQDGKVEDRRLARALQQLAAYQNRHHRRMVVLMAFGREAEVDLEHDADLQDVKRALVELARAGATIVASAGNQANDHPQYPAAFADDRDLEGFVVSVGAGAGPTEPADYSSFGPWVKKWRQGTNAVSLMPVQPHVIEKVDGEPFSVSKVGDDNYAWWSGTSFAAAIYACEQAERLMGQYAPLKAE